MIEVILSLFVVALLVGAVGLGVAGGTQTAYLNEGSDRFETLLRMARAEAAARGKVLRLEFDEASRPRITIELKPLEEPGVFVPYLSGWATGIPNELVVVTRCAADTTDAYIPPDETSAMTNESRIDETRFDPIGFRPDGSCDSATLELRSTDARDLRTAEIKVDGVNGLFTTTLLTPSEREARKK